MWGRYAERVKAENIRVICRMVDPSRPQAISLWAWARLQDPPLTWLDARRLAESGEIKALRCRWPGKARLHWTIDVDRSLVDTLGLLAAVRLAGWRRPST